MGETIAVLIVFFFLIVIGLVFYVQVVKKKVDVDIQEFNQLESLTVMNRVLALPELQCTEQDIARESCVDLLKVEAAERVMASNDLYYYDLLGFSNISLVEIYPEQRAFTVYDRPLPNFTSKSATRIPVAIQDPKEEGFRFGLMVIETYT